MKLNLQVKLDGADRIRKRIEIVQKAPSIMLKSIGESEVKSAQHRIQTSKQSPDGTGWAPWKMSTLRQRTQDGTSSGGLLHRTGALLRSISYKLAGKTVTITSSAPYAKYLQNGTPRMQARPFLGWSKQSINKIKQILNEAVNKQ